MRDEWIAPFNLPRLRSLASGIFRRDAIPPIEISSPARKEGYLYRVRNGFHRFHLCLEFGLTTIPTVIIDFDEWT
jgi:hypothetical protein